MSKPAILFVLFFVSLAVSAQKPKPVKKTPFNPAQNAQTAANTGSEKEEFDKAAAVTDAAERVQALNKFIASFPRSAQKINAQELIVISRAQLGDEKLKNNDTAEGVKYFKLAVKDAPQPFSDKLFNEILVQIPSNLFFRGQREAAIETARVIERKIGGNAKQLIGLATFYLGIEDASEASRLADLALTYDAQLPAAYQTLGIASRLNFQLDDAVKDYARALELDENSAVSKRSLAEMKRAVGKADEAVTLYRELLAKDETDAQSQTGLTLALFDDGKQAAAETEMAKALAQNPNNLPLLVGAAYWYAAHKEGAKAIELAGKAAAFEPRFIWARIALARGYLQQKRPLDAERELLAARQYGNFPTLDYEIAAARLQAGFFREAAEALQTDFTVKDGILTVKLGGRVEKSASNFIELLTPERRASIFEPLAADDPESGERLKVLLALMKEIDAPAADNQAISRMADEFIDGGDPMKLHRQMFVARQLLDKRKNIDKAAEIAQATIGKTDAALGAPNSSAAVLADALYDSRRAAAQKNEVIIVPDVPRQTLSAILRGEIEELIGWSAFQQNKPDEAVLHLKRAVSVLPDKSSYWRAGLWRLGAAYQAQGDDKQALESYLKSYPTDAPSGAKYIVIEALYKKLNDGKTDGLEDKIGKKPELTFVANSRFGTAETPAQNFDPPKTETAPAEPVTPTVSNSTESAQTNNNPTNPAKTDEVPPPAPEIPQPAPALAENAPKSDSAVKNSPAASENKAVETAVKTVETSQTAAKSPIETTPADTVKPKNKAADDEQNKPVSTLPAPVAAENRKARPTVIITNAPSEKPSKQQPKPLFEPIIIQVPPVSNPAKSAEDTDSTPSEKPDAPANDQISVKPTDDISRARVIVSSNLPAAQCSISVAQESVTLISSGGSIGLIINYENQTKADQIKAVSSSPNDVDVSLESGIAGLSGRSFFLIKSISANTGEYKVTFETPCGKKEISVKVR